MSHAVNVQFASAVALLLLVVGGGGVAWRVGRGREGDGTVALVVAEREAFLGDDNTGKPARRAFGVPLERACEPKQQTNSTHTDPSEGTRQTKATVLHVTQRRYPLCLPLSWQIRRC